VLLLLLRAGAFAVFFLSRRLPLLLHAMTGAAGRITTRTPTTHDLCG
jgi:hypothetical protein